MADLYSKTVTSKNPKAMYNGGLRNSAIRYIVVHHNATTNKNVAMNTWVQGSGSYTSAHYEITDNEIIGCVGENYVAYHSGGTGGSDVPKITNINQRSIGLEHVNSSGAPKWGVSDKTLRQSAKLIAEICKRYNLPIDRSTIKTHGEITATACPGGMDVNKLVKYAKEAAGQKTNTPSEKPKAENDVDYMRKYGQVAWNKKWFDINESAKFQGLDQVYSYILAGHKGKAKATNEEWQNNGIPTSGITRKGNKLQFKQDVMDIVDYDKPSNGIAVKVAGYKVWVDATTARKA